MVNPIELIDTIKSSDGYIPMIYMQGGCYQFYKILKVIYPNAEPYMVKMDECEHYNHVVTKIDDRYYDIEGEFYDICNYEIAEVDESVNRWGFSSSHIIMKECECGNEIEFYSNYVK